VFLTVALAKKMKSAGGHTFDSETANGRKYLSVEDSGVASQKIFWGVKSLILG